MVLAGMLIWAVAWRPTVQAKAPEPASPAPSPHAAPPPPSAPRAPAEAQRAAPVEPLFQGRTAAGWLSQLKEPDPRRKLEALEALDRLRPPAAAAVPALCAALQDSNSAVQSLAARALAGYGADAAAAVPALLEALKDPEGPSLDAIRTLGAIGPSAAAAVPLLKSSVLRVDYRQESSFMALGRIGGEGLGVLSEALQLYRDAGYAPPAGLLEALAQAGKAAVPIVLPCLADPRP